MEPISETSEFFKTREFATETRQATVKIFRQAMFHFNYKLYKSLLAAIQLSIIQKIELNATELKLTASLVDIALWDLRCAKNNTVAPEGFLPLNSKEIKIIVSLLERKINHEEQNRDNQEFDLEALIDMKLALLELKTLTLAEIID